MPDTNLASNCRACPPGEKWGRLEKTKSLTERDPGAYNPRLFVGEVMPEVRRWVCGYGPDDVEFVGFGRKKWYLTPHASEQREKRKIRLEQIERALDRPDDRQESKSKQEDRWEYRYRIGQRALKVIVNEKLRMVISVMWEVRRG